MSDIHDTHTSAIILAITYAVCGDHTMCKWLNLNRDSSVVNLTVSIQHQVMLKIYISYSTHIETIVSEIIDQRSNMLDE